MTIAVIDELLRIPREWLATYGTSMHYRWPQTTYKLYELTGDSRYKDLLLWGANWTLVDPYAIFGEFRSSQSYSGILPPKRMNWERMLYQTIYGYILGGDRESLDWMMNMFDEMIGPERDKRSKGVSGKAADNPTRAMGIIAPYRMVALYARPGYIWPGRLEVRFPSREVTEVQHAYFISCPPGEYAWKIIVRNVWNIPVNGTLEIGPVPTGMTIQASHSFQLDVGKEKEIEIPMDFTDEFPSGRTKVPYAMYTADTSGYKAERRGFIAIHAFKPIPEGKYPRLLLYAPLDDDGPAKVANGDPTPLTSGLKFIDGKYGRALSNDSGGLSFATQGNILAEQGTFSIWLQHSKVKVTYPTEIMVHGCGSFFIRFRCGQGALDFNGCCYEYPQELNKPGTWQHYVIIWDVDILKFFIDGKQVALELNRPSPTNTRTLVDGELVPLATTLQKHNADDIPAKDMKRIRLGAPSHRIELIGEQYGYSDFDDLRIYSAPLNESEIKELYQR